jgi:SAM-dependent methyltransferase
MREHRPYTVLAGYYDLGWNDYSRYMAELIELLEKESRRRFFSTVCDAACGTGLLLKRLAGGGRTVCGYDSSSAMIDRARERLPGVPFSEGDLREEPPFGGPFELVTCVYDSLNYLLTENDLVAALAMFRRIIDRDGVLIIDCNDRTMYDDPAQRVRHRIISGVGIRERLDWEPGPPPRATTVFEFPDGVEHHVQRPWDSSEVEEHLHHSGWEILDTLDVMDASRDEPSGKIVYTAVPGEVPSRLSP